MDLKPPIMDVKPPISVPTESRQHLWKCVAPENAYYRWQCQNPGCSATAPYPSDTRPPSSCPSLLPVGRQQTVLVNQSLPCVDCGEPISNSVMHFDEAHSSGRGVSPTIHWYRQPNQVQMLEQQLKVAQSDPKAYIWRACDCAQPRFEPHGAYIRCTACLGLKSQNSDEPQTLASLPVGESTRWTVNPCKHCGHDTPHDGPAGTIDDACTTPGCDCGFYEPELGLGESREPLQRVTYVDRNKEETT